MKRITIAKILSLVGSVLGGMALYYIFSEGNAPEFMSIGMFLAPLLAFVSYCMCGFFKALGTPFSWAKWGFVIAPFPANLLAVVLLFLLGMLSVAFLPAAPVFKRAAELGY